jgi:hypothetical protein
VKTSHQGVLFLQRRAGHSLCRFFFLVVVFDVFFFFFNAILTYKRTWKIGFPFFSNHTQEEKRYFRTGLHEMLFEHSK